LIDRLQYGEVIDFILLYHNSFYWPAFNVADVFISAGVVSVIVSIFLEKNKSNGELQ